MADGNYVLPAPESVTLSGDTARRLVGCGSGDAALLYLHILLSGGRLDREDAARHMGRTEAQVETALEVLARLGLVSAQGPARPREEKADELPQYTTEDITRELENGAAFRLLVGEVERALGKLLSSDDLMRLFGIYDYLGLPPEVILQLVIHCITEQTARFGPGRKPTMRYIEKAAFAWEREGIFSLDAAEAYIMRQGERDAARAAWQETLGLTGRALTNTEKRYIDAWAELGFTPEAAAIAYDRTVTNTGKLNWRYMDSNLKRWHQKGLHTPREIREKDTFGGPKKTRTEKVAEVTYDDVKRNEEALRKLREGSQ